MREIKIRAWRGDAPKKEREMIYFNLYNAEEFLNPFWDTAIMQYTGLKDKNGLIEIFEGDIIDIEGNMKGNQYENPDLLKEKTNFLIQGFGTKDWCETYKKAMERGCQNAQ